MSIFAPDLALMQILGFAKLEQNRIILSLSVQKIYFLKISTFCGGGTRRSGPILPISELDLSLTIILRCTKFGPNRILPSRVIVRTSQTDRRTDISRSNSNVRPETDLVQRDLGSKTVISMRHVLAVSNDIYPL